MESIFQTRFGPKVTTYFDPKVTTYLYQKVTTYFDQKVTTYLNPFWTTFERPWPPIRGTVHENMGVKKCVFLITPQQEMHRTPKKRFALSAVKFSAFFKTQGGPKHMKIAPKARSYNRAEGAVIYGLSPG